MKRIIALLLLVVSIVAWGTASAKWAYLYGYRCDVCAAPKEQMKWVRRDCANVQIGNTKTYACSYEPNYCTVTEQRYYNKVEGKHTDGYVCQSRKDGHSHSKKHSACGRSSGCYYK